MPKPNALWAAEQSSEKLVFSSYTAQNPPSSSGWVSGCCSPISVQKAGLPVQHCRILNLVFSLRGRLHCGVRAVPYRFISRGWLVPVGSWDRSFGSRNSLQELKKETLQPAYSQKMPKSRNKLYIPAVCKEVNLGVFVFSINPLL